MKQQRYEFQLVNDRFERNQQRYEFQLVKDSVEMSIGKILQ
jgi:hypothetical protein